LILFLPLIGETMNFQRRLFNKLGLMATASSWTSLGFAQSFPTKPIKIIVPYGAGGTADAVTRPLAERLAIQLKQPVVIDNRPGASGSIGLAAVAQSPADGYTLGMTLTSPLTTLPHMVKLPYNPEKDLTPIVPVMYSPVLIVATSAFKGNSFQDLISQAKSRPNSIAFASGGQGTIGHILIESLNDSAKVEFLHVPYKTSAQIVTDAISGTFDVMVINPFPALNQQIQAGKLKVLALAAPSRLDEYPGIPTMAELGYKNSQIYSTLGVVAPSGMPTDLVTLLNREINRAMQSPSVLTAINSNFSRIAGGSSGDYAQALRNESVGNARIIKLANIKID
jgi:tripartite-type tricarboxylate transporter receptor subunit TctC